MPFLSIVTRHLTNRKALLSRCVQSLESQTDMDFEHIIIEDPIGIGIEQANQSLFLNRNRVNGKYVFILDDDVWVTSDHFVETIKTILSENPYDILFFKSLRPSGIMPRIWMLADRGVIDTACAVVQKDLWKSSIHRFMPYRGGDGVFIKHLTKRTDNVLWYDSVFTTTDKARFGGD